MLFGPGSSIGPQLHPSLHMLKTIISRSPAKPLTHCIVRGGRVGGTGVRYLATADTKSAIDKESLFNDLSVVFVGPVWPETSSSAAGVRTWDLIENFTHGGARVTFVSGSKSEGNPHVQRLIDIGADAIECQPNREERFVHVLEAARPDIVVFDRFYSEEAYSFRVKKCCPEALRVLDMQDCHFLRAERQKLVKSGQISMKDMLAARPSGASPETLRELASIHRSDLTLVCSPFETSLLSTEYGISSSKLVDAPFFPKPSPYRNGTAPGYTDRLHFMMIGNFKHPPNMDAARWTCREMWPAIREQLPGVELHLYGAYPPDSGSDLHRPVQGIHLNGFAPSLDIMLQYRVCLAPLRYGAGLKGKVVDSWWHGLPVSTTLVGSEGMTLPHDDPNTNPVQPWGGTWSAATPEETVQQAVELYSDQELWTEAQATGFMLLRRMYDREQGLAKINDALLRCRQSLDNRRARDYVGSILWREESRSTEYFSRWIELKEKLESLNKP